MLSIVGTLQAVANIAQISVLFVTGSVFSIVKVDRDFIDSNYNNWRASEASETLSGVYKFELVRYIYIYMYGGTYAIIVAHATHT